MPEATARFRRRGVRLAGHDYASPGAYLITICTRGRSPVLGRVQDGQMRLSAIGTIAANCWTAIPGHFPRVVVDTWAIRPDHLHGILILRGRGDACVAPTRSSPSCGPPRGSIPAIVGAFKSAVTRQVNQMRGPSGVSIWQRGFYEQILWDTDALQRARDYVGSQQSA